MIRVRVTNTLRDLARDTRRVATKSDAKLETVVRKNAQAGNRIAKANAKASAGKHGHPYPRTFTAERVGPGAWEYGPDADKVHAGKTGSFNPGGMATGFEEGSRNQPAHHDLDKSRIVQGPIFADDVGRAAEDLFW